MLTPRPLANILLVVAATMFAMALVSGELVVQAVIGLLLAGQLVGAATKR